MRRTNTKNQKKIILWLGVIFFVWLLINIIIGIGNKRIEIEKLNKVIVQNDIEIKKLEEQKAEIKSRITKIEDRKEIERIAREHLQMVKEGEVVYRISE